MAADEWRKHCRKGTCVRRAKGQSVQPGISAGGITLLEDDTMSCHAFRSERRHAAIRRREKLVSDLKSQLIIARNELYGWHSWWAMYKHQIVEDNVAGQDVDPDIHDTPRTLNSHVFAPGIWVRECESEIPNFKRDDKEDEDCDAHEACDDYLECRDNLPSEGDDPQDAGDGKHCGKDYGSLDDNTSEECYDDHVQETTDVHEIMQEVHFIDEVKSSRDKIFEQLQLLKSGLGELSESVKAGQRNIDGMVQDFNAKVDECEHQHYSEAQAYAHQGRHLQTLWEEDDDHDVEREGTAKGQLRAFIATNFETLCRKDVGLPGVDDLNKLTEDECEGLLYTYMDMTHTVDEKYMNGMFMHFGDLANAIFKKA